MALKFGKNPPKFHPKTLLFSDWLPRALPTPEQKRAWEYVVSDRNWAASMLGNDTVGDCVIAAMLHYIMAARANIGKPVIFTTDQALKLYSAITGYDPAQTDANGNNPTDNGTAWTDALAYWQKIGVTLPDGSIDKILGWAALDPTSLPQVRQGISIFGGVLIGTNVTSSMMNQFNAGQPWNPPFSNDSEGGHGIPWLGFGRLGQTCLTWACRQQMSPDALSQVDEGYVVVTEDFINSQGQSPSGLILDALEADLKAIAA
jgi:hypothetical protein